MENVKEIKGISVESLKKFFDNNNTVNTLEDLNNIYDKFCSEVEPLTKNDFLEVCCSFLYNYIGLKIQYNYNPKLWEQMCDVRLKLEMTSPIDWEDYD